MSAKTEPLNIYVAAAHLDEGTIQLTNECPEDVHLAPGQELHLLVRYSFHEATRRREEFHVKLRSRLAQQGPMEQTVDIADHLVRSDAEWGVMEQPFEGLAPGRHELFVDVSAGYGVRGWRGKGEERLQQSEFAITLPVIVDEA